jgi:hypothetical protein
LTGSIGALKGIPTGSVYSASDAAAFVTGVYFLVDGGAASF